VDTGEMLTLHQALSEGQAGLVRCWSQRPLPPSLPPSLTHSLTHSPEDQGPASCRVYADARAVRTHVCMQLLQQAGNIHAAAWFELSRDNSHVKYC
jgi:hypothetical protein